MYNPFGALSEQDDDPRTQNYGVPGRGQLQPVDAGAAPQQAPASATNYQQPAAPWAPAPPQAVPSGRDQQDPTKMQGPVPSQTAPISQGGLAGASQQFMADIQRQTPQASAPLPAPWDTAPSPAERAQDHQQRPQQAQGLVPGQVSFGQFGANAAQQNPMEFRGFNDARALASGDDKSAKDAFRRIIGGTGIDVRGLAKPDVGAKLAAEVVPALEAAGYPARVKPGEYDIIEVFSNERGWEPIDVVENAGSAKAAWQWGDQPGQGAPPMTGPLNAGLMQQAAQGAGAEEMAMAESLGIDTSHPLWKQMFAAWYSNQQGMDPSAFGLTVPPQS